LKCEHKHIAVVFAAGKELDSGGIEKDLVVDCSDCHEELFRMSVYHKQIFNLLPD
jgi:hypothetical protein